MTYTVGWSLSACDELATEWLRGDAAMRSMITAATEQVDVALKADPSTFGESNQVDVGSASSDHSAFCTPLTSKSDLS